MIIFGIQIGLDMNEVIGELNISDFIPIITKT